MSFAELVRVALGTLASNKLRSALTLLGMVIGVFAIIVAVTAVQVVESSVSGAVSSFGSNRVTASAQAQLGTNDRWRYQPLTYEDVRLIASRVQIAERVSPEGRRWAQRVRYGGITTDPMINFIGTDEHWLENNGYDLSQGRFLSPDDVQFARPVAILGSSVAQKLFPQENPLGKQVGTDGGSFLVVGVMDEKGQAFGSSQDDLVIMPITRFLSYVGDRRVDVSLNSHAPNALQVGEVVEELTGHLRVVRGLRPGEANNFVVETNESLLEGFSNVAKSVAFGGAGIGLLTLFAAGIGIMNIMLVSVTERTREIGIRKSLGATKGDILRQFLLEAIVLCQIGGILGLFSGIGVGNLVGIFFDTGVVVPWGWALSAVFGVSLFGVFFGVYPAWKAARLDPIDALRFE